MNGYIKLHRSMLTWEWMDDPITVQVWIYCLLRANYETQRWHGEIVKPGQFVTSLSHMAKDLGISMQNLRTALNHLKSTHELTSKVTKSATLITIEKWAVYQSAGEKVTSHLTHELTNDQQTPNKELTTIEESKKEEEIKKERDMRESLDADIFAQQHKLYADIKARLAGMEV